MSPIAGAWCAIEISRFDITVRFGAQPTVAFARVLASFRQTFPPHTGAQWQRRERCWTLPVSLGSAVRAWSSSSFEPGAVDWAELPGSAHGGQAGRVRRPAINEAARAFAAALYVAPDAPPEVIEAARRVLAKRHHPDVSGGSDSAMQAINRAADELLARTAQGKGA